MVSLPGARPLAHFVFVATLGVVFVSNDNLCISRWAGSPKVLWTEKDLLSSARFSYITKEQRFGLADAAAPMLAPL